MNYCPSCEKRFKDSLVFCPFDGVALLSEKDRDELVGAVLDGKFRIIEKVGEGGMGKVYKAKHIHLDHTVAVKVLHAHLSLDKMVLERFRREAQAAIYVRHPNAVVVTDFGVTSDSGRAYLVMEFLSGTELREEITRQGYLPYEYALLVTQQTCAALQAAHAKGVIHRDLKPENIWLIKNEDGSPQVKVLDFGIAKFKLSSNLGKLTQQGTVIGTPLYMSPEQCCGEELDGRSDVYSLGVIIYEMLTGRVPFQAPHIVGVIFKHMHESPPSLKSYRPDIPPAVEEVVLRALAKEREGRQQSPSQLAFEFEMAIKGVGLKPHTGRVNTPAVAPENPDLLRTTPYSLPQAFRQDSNPQITQSSPNEFEPERSVESEEITYIAKPPSQQSPNPALPKFLFNEPTSSRDSGYSEQADRRALTDTGFQLGRKTVNLKDVFASGKGRIITGIAAAIIIVAVIIIKATGPSKPVITPGQAAAEPVAPAGMVYVRGGTFKMGTNDATGDEPNCMPAHTVTVKPFFLDANEVTNEEYQKFIDATKRKAPSHWEGNKYPTGTAMFPVYNINWEDASAYAKWAGKRLPTEAEWEYAARGPEGQQFPWGATWSERKANLKETRLNGANAVGQFPEGKSWCGANDLVGNISEWVFDNFKPYPNAPGEPSANYRIVRGGSFKDTKDKPWSIIRRLIPPKSLADDRGFRCAKDAQP